LSRPPRCRPNLSVVKDLLGHDDIRTTINIYGHLLPSVDAALADGLDALYSDAPDNVEPLRRGAARTTRTGRARK